MLRCQQGARSGRQLMNILLRNLLLGLKLRLLLAPSTPIFFGILGLPRIKFIHCSRSMILALINGVLGP